MSRLSKGLAAGIVAVAALIGAAGQAAAQSTTTTTPTTTTTTTTLLPHPFSAATRRCIHKARADFRACHRTGTAADCTTAFQTAFANCFAAGAGVSCAKKCVTKETTCLTAAPATDKTCGKACVKTRRADVLACRRIADGDNIWAGGDAACLTTAAANFDLCKFVCAEAALDCRIALKFCIANCRNL